MTQLPSAVARALARQANLILIDLQGEPLSDVLVCAVAPCACGPNSGVSEDPSCMQVMMIHSQCAREGAVTSACLSCRC